MSDSCYTLMPTLKPSACSPDADRVDLVRAAELSGMHPQMILEFVRADFVHVMEPDDDGSPLFDQGGIRRLTQIEHLRSTEHVNLRTISFIMRLLDALDDAESELSLVRERNGGG